MRINHNISALKANNQLTSNDGKLAKSLEKLTSGLKINHAADDAAGMAISQKMRTQIAGLDKASNNASDGISVIQTAEGALEEVNSCLQRMRELSVQAANGTYTTDDRVAIQQEITALNAEITRISETTEFNTKHLLDGTIDRKAFSNTTSVNIVSVSDTVPSADQYHLEIKEDARQAVLVGSEMPELPTTGTATKITKEQAGKININGQDIKIEEGDTYDEVFEKIRDTCADLDIYCFATGPNLSTVGGESIYAGYRTEKFGSGGTEQSIYSTEILGKPTAVAGGTVTVKVNGTAYTGTLAITEKTYTVTTANEEVTFNVDNETQPTSLSGAEISVDTITALTDATNNITGASSTTLASAGEEVSIKINSVIYKGDATATVTATSCEFVTENGAKVELTIDSNSVKSAVITPPASTNQCLAFVSANYGSKEEVSILCNNVQLASIFGLSTNTITVYGNDVKAELPASANDFSTTATISMYGNSVKISDNNNFEIKVDVEPNTAGTVFRDKQINNVDTTSGQVVIGGNDQEVTFTVLDSGPLSLHIGANAYQTMEISIPAVTPKILGVDTVNISTEAGAQRAIEAVSTAINTVAGIRAKLGAFQNRLEHAISNLDTGNENMTESLSRIEDTDMAKEMAEYTQLNVLVQAGTSMLAQANQRPQSVLQLVSQ